MDGRVQHDGFGRDINYLRIAVTDKCNFRCIYCMPADGVAPRAHDELLSAEEIARFVRLVAGEGIRRSRGFVGRHRGPASGLGGIGVPALGHMIILRFGT